MNFIKPFLPMALLFLAMAAYASPDPQQAVPSSQLPILSNLQDNDAVGPIVRFEIGRKKFGCLRFGFCRLTLESADIIMPPVPTIEKSAAGSATIIKGKLSVEFYRTSMTADTYDAYFGGDSFIVEEDFDVPAEVSTALGVKSYKIKAGIYPTAPVGTDMLSVTF